MKRVKTADAKNNLSRHLEYVRRGGRVRILDRETPVADLVPVEAGDAGGDDDAALLTALARRGVLRIGKGGVPAELFRPGPKVGTAAVDALLAERRGSR